MSATIAIKPLPIRLLNKIGATTTKLGHPLISLNKGDLFKKAIKKANGLTDFGPGDFEAGLDKLLESLENECGLATFGRIVAQTTVVDFLSNRLLIQDYLKRHPSVSSEKIHKPIFIIGPARSGTTITQYLLLQDQRFRSPLIWESFDLYPPVKPETFSSDPRIKQIEKRMAGMAMVAPEAEAAHPQTAWDAQECVLLHSLEFMSGQFMPMFGCWNYQTWIDNQPWLNLYSREKLMLQFMQSGGYRKERWLLKCPVHINRIEEILSVFPDAEFIQTHREPLECAVSAASLCVILQQIGKDHIDFKDVGWRFVDLMEKHMRGNVEQRDRLRDQSHRFFDMHMSDVVRDPIACVESAYAHFGIDLPDKTSNKMRTYMQENSLEKKKKHHYTPEEFGISFEKEWDRFSFYRHFYGLKERRR